MSTADTPRSQRIPHLWPVVPAGGSGTRLWPLSRSSRPKFLLDLLGAGRSLLQATYDRLAPLADGDVTVVTGQKHAAAVSQQLEGCSRVSVLAEPAPRESLPAIAWAAAVVERQDPDGVIGSFAADHVISRLDRFGECVREAVACAREGYLTTIGIEATHPATGFGYIRSGEPLGIQGAPRGMAVRSFVEKPDEATAREYVASGEYRWNAGMFVARATDFLDLAAQWQPQIVEAARAIAADSSSLEQPWEVLDGATIDVGVAEPAADAGRVAVVPGDFPWDDVGGFTSLAPLVAEGGEPVTVLPGSAETLTLDSTGIVGALGGRTVVTLGVDDLVVVDTPDAVLVTTRDRAQDIKKIVAELKATGREDLT